MELHIHTYTHTYIHTHITLHIHLSMLAVHERFPTAGWLLILHMHVGKTCRSFGGVERGHQRRHLKRFPLPFCGERKERGGARDLLFIFLPC